jgi:hypothetical protein
MGSLPGYEAVGELHHFWGRGAIENWKCADGQLFNTHPVWRKCLDAVASAGPCEPIIDKFERTERLRDARHKILRQIPEALRENAERYRQDFLTIYTCLKDQTGAEVIVDSGKVPLHAALMQGCPNLDFRILHLIRDPRAFVLAKSHPKESLGASAQPFEMAQAGALRSIFRWRQRNQDIYKLSAYGLYARMAYSTFAHDPADAIRTTLKELSLRLPGDIADRFPNRTFECGMGLSFSGNPNRLGQSIVTIRNDEAWKRKLSRPKQALAHFICAPTLRALGPC